MKKEGKRKEGKKMTNERNMEEGEKKKETCRRTAKVIC